MDGKKSAGGQTAALGRVFAGIDRVLSAIEGVMTALVVVTMFAVMAVVALDGLGRYLFNRPIAFTVDLVAHHLLPILMILPASMVLRRAKHISVDLFATLMPARLYQALIGISLLATAPMFWIMTYRVALDALESFAGNKVQSGLIPWPLWAEQAIYVVCLGLLTLRLLHVAATNLTAAAVGKTDIAISMLNPHNSPLEEVI